MCNSNACCKLYGLSTPPFTRKDKTHSRDKYHIYMETRPILGCLDPMSYNTSVCSFLLYTFQCLLQVSTFHCTVWWVDGKVGDVPKMVQDDPKTRPRGPKRHHGGPRRPHRPLPEAPRGSRELPRRPRRPPRPSKTIENHYT